MNIYRLVTCGEEVQLVLAIAPGDLDRRHSIRWLKRWADEHGWTVAKSEGDDEATALIQELEPI